MIILYILMGMFAFSALILVHEFGHFFVAKMNGVQVEKFAIFFGRPLLSKKMWGTEFVIGWIPMGGYVKFLGDDEEVEDKNSFWKLHPARKLSIHLAGPVMNLITAFVLLAVVAFSIGGYATLKIKDTVPASPAFESGIMAGDTIKEVNGKEMKSAEDFQALLFESKGEPINVVVDRNSETKNLTISPEKNKDADGYKIGVLFDVKRGISVSDSLVRAKDQMVSFTKLTFSTLGALVTGKGNFKTDLGGPVTIIKATVAQAEMGILNLVYFSAVISLQLAIFNLLPIPALDGGSAVIDIVETVTGKRFKMSTIEKIQSIGMALLFCLMIAVTIKDILFPVSF